MFITFINNSRYIGIMRQIIIYFMLLGTSAIAQTKGYKLWKYVDSCVGTKVGDGDCATLLKMAYKSVCGCNPMRKIGHDKYVYTWGTEVSVDSLKPGDIADFDYFLSATGEQIAGHVGIVYSVSKDEIMIANQNFMVPRKKDSKVVVVELDEIMEYDPKYIQKVNFYRP